MSRRTDDIDQELDKAIKNTDDPKDRAMLMLIQKMLIHVEKLLDDEESLRVKVFNGNYINHTTDHDYIEDLRVLDSVEAIKWVNNRINTSGQCAWSAKKIEQERENTKAWKDKLNDFLFEISKTSIYVVLGMAFYALATGFPLLSKIVG